MSFRIRIYDFFRQPLSSSTQSMVEAETHDNVHFTLRLFANKGKIVVEMQRNCGCCILFHQYCKTVLRAAKGLEPLMVVQTYPLPSNLPTSPESEERINLEQDLENAATMLKKDRIDAQALAMESLSHLSKSTKCDCLVAKTVIGGPLMETIASLVECWSVCKEDARSGEEKVGEVEEQLCSAMRRWAMIVLANCLNALSTEEMKEQREHALSPSLLMALVDELRRADERPHDACEAARCLQACIKSCPDHCKARLVEYDAEKAASIALDAGTCSHSNLEKESRLLSQQITNC